MEKRERERDKRRRDLSASRRARPTQPTQVELEEHEQAGHKQNRSWCCASLGRADAHVTRPAEGGGMPVIGVDYGCFWNRAAESVDGERDEILGEEPPDEVRRSSLVLCGRCTVQTGGSSAISIRQKVTTRESDGQPPNLTHTRAVRAVTAVAEVPSEVVQEQVSKGRSPGIGLAEGAVKEVKEKIRTVRHAAEAGMGRQIPKHHDERVEGWCRRSCKPSAGNLRRVTVSNESLPFMHVFLSTKSRATSVGLGEGSVCFVHRVRRGDPDNLPEADLGARRRLHAAEPRGNQGRDADHTTGKHLEDGQLCANAPEETWKAAQIVQNRTRAEKCEYPCATDHRANRGRRAH